MDRAYTWYTTLRLGSIKTWDKMVERFCAKYYPGEDKVTFQSLQMVRQRPREDPVQFIKRFEDVSLDCYGDHEEKELLETCISNMLFDYRLNLENLYITQFFTRNLGRKPWSLLRSNPRCKGTLYPIKRGREWWLW